MKKFILHFAIAAAAILVNFAPLTAEAQVATTYSPETEANIKLVEQSLAGPVQVTGQPKWTLAERMSLYKIPGLSIAVVHQYKIAWAKGYGWADVSEHRPVTANTLFQAASISKSLNAMGVLRLAQDHRIDLYADINNYLRSWKFPYDSLSKNKKISTANLLSHTGGLDIHGFPGYAAGEPLPSVVQILDGQKPANTKAVRSLFEPGLRFQYSGGGTTISQLMVTEITKMPYDQYMKEAVLAPLGMNSSFYTQPAPSGKKDLLATAYYENGSEYKGKYHTYPEEAPAGLWTNPSDLARFIIEMQLSYEGKSNKVLSAEYTKLMVTPYIDKSTALGVGISIKNGSTYFQHSGGNAGFRSFYIGSLANGEGVVIMVNSDQGKILDELVNSVATVYNWKGYNAEAKTDAKLTPQQLSELTGKYIFQFEPGKDAFIVITATETGLTLKQMWDDQEINFVPESDLKFFCKERPFTLRFIRDDKGVVNQVSAFERDVWTKVKAE